MRVTAGAGTGKTTTLEHLTARLAAVGHTEGRYVVFGKSMQVRRSLDTGDGITVHCSGQCTRDPDTASRNIRDSGNLYRPVL